MCVYKIWVWEHIAVLAAFVSNNKSISSWVPTILYPVGFIPPCYPSFSVDGVIIEALPTPKMLDFMGEYTQPAKE